MTASKLAEGNLQIYGVAVIPKRGLLVHLESRQGLEQELEAFLHAAQVLAQADRDALMWYALKLGRNEYAIVNGFGSEQARNAHARGPIMQALVQETGALLTASPQIERFDVLASKLPDAGSGVALDKGLLVSMQGRVGRSSRLERLLCQAAAWVTPEPRTAAWCALRMERRKYAMLALFPGPGARLSHLLGRLPRKLAVPALSLLAALPKLNLTDVLAATYA